MIIMLKTLSFFLKLFLNLQNNKKYINKNVEKANNHSDANNVGKADNLSISERSMDYGYFFLSSI